MNIGALKYSLLMCLVAAACSRSTIADDLITKHSSTAVTPRPVIKGNVTATGITDALEVAGIKCALQVDKKPTLVVNTVHIGTPAYYAGVTAGDTILKIATTSNGFQLTLNRNGKVYQANVHSESAARMLASSANDFNLLAARDNVKLSKLAPQAASQKTLLASKATDLQSNAKNIRVVLQAGDDRLLTYNIEFIIDVSSSMNLIDDTDGMSKFEWCRNQVTSLAERLAPYAETFTITVFNERYQTAESCNRNAIIDIYSHVRPHGSTDLVDPLVARCNAAVDNYRPGSKPTLIAVITDGLPNHPHDPTVVNRALVDLTKRLKSPKQLLITFLQIGATFDGKDFCEDLDQNLVREGATYDIVDTSTFADLKSKGLSQCLIHAIEAERAVK